MHEEQLRVEFNEWAGAGRGASMERGHRPTGEQGIDLMQIGPEARVLDLGCGNGWASRSMAAKATAGHVIGIDVADQMVEVARKESTGFSNLEFRVASAEALPFADGEFTHVFSMESIYYYGDLPRALSEVYRVLAAGGSFAAVVDFYRENKPSLLWVDQMHVPVQLLSTEEYRNLFNAAGFINIEDRRLLDPSPAPSEYTGTSFSTLEDLLEFRANGSLMISGRKSS